MKKYTLIMKRTYETIFEIEAENVTKAINKLNNEIDKYTVELEQCCVVNEEIECINEDEIIVANL